MQDVRIAACQFEHQDGDTEFNLGRIDALTDQAARQGAEIVSFHECCISAYSFVQPFSKQELLGVSEPVPGRSTGRLIEIAGRHGVHLLAGLFEEQDGEVYNTYLCVNGDGIVAKFRKLHPFVSPHLAAGNDYVVFDVNGTKCGILICYDNNLCENARITSLLGAEVIFAPHVTGCLPSTMPGRGVVDPLLWQRREVDPVPLRQEFAGPKGRGWLMRWLPTRAWENGVYIVFTNPVGMDYGQVRNGNSMILDPFGEVLVECNTLGDDVVVGLCTADKLPLASGHRYLRARRPDLYAKMVEPPSEPPVTAPGWDLQHKR